MKVTFPKPEDGFKFTPCTIAGVECVLIGPTDIKTKFNESNKIFRSSIWTLEGEPVSLGYRKFVNYGEAPTFEPLDISDPALTFPTKKDGTCCDGDTRIETEDGIKTIREICEGHYLGRVLGYDHSNNQIKFTKIVAHSVKSNKNDWFLLTLDDGTEVKLTGSHLVWLPVLSCYRRVDQLKGDEEFLMSKLKKDSVKESKTLHKQNV